MDEEPAAHNEDQRSRIRHRLQQHPESNAQVQGSQQQERSGARCPAHEEELEERDGSADHQQPRDQLVQRQALEEQGQQNGYHADYAEHRAVDGVVQGQPLQVLICYLNRPKSNPKTKKTEHQTELNMSNDSANKKYAKVKTVHNPTKREHNH